MPKDFTIIPGRRPKVKQDPYTLADGTHISLTSLLETLAASSSEQDGGRRVCQIGFVFASGRDAQCMGQAGLVCDALWTPEIAALLVRGIDTVDTDVFSVLDIDAQEMIRAGMAGSEDIKPHLILCGTGDINGITADAIAHFEDIGTPLRPGLRGPTDADPIGYRGTRYSAPTDPCCGLLTAFRSPWWGDRVAVICGGIHGVGTVGALWMLHEYLAGRGSSWNGNRFNPQVPGKILDVRHREYPNVELRSVGDMVPQHDVRNIISDQSEIEILE